MWLLSSHHYRAALYTVQGATPGTPVRAVMPISGIFDLRPITTSYLQPEVQLTAEEVAHWSPIEAVPSTCHAARGDLCQDGTPRAAASVDRRLGRAPAAGPRVACTSRMLQELKPVEPRSKLRILGIVVLVAVVSLFVLVIGGAVIAATGASGY